MTSHEFQRIACFLGFSDSDNEVQGRGVAGEVSPGQLDRLVRFACGDPGNQSRDQLVTELLRDPSLLAAFADVVKNKGKVPNSAPPSDTADIVSLSDFPQEMDDEVSGRDTDVLEAPPARPQLKCYSCHKTFGLASHPDPEKVYVCCCGAHNRMGLPIGGKTWSGIELAKIPSSYLPARPLDSLFLTGPDGAVYEVPRLQAAAWKLTPKRILELGHLPFDLSGRFDSDEIQGRHKMPCPGGGSSPLDWTFHSSWEFGCYFSPGQNAFVVGYHRHPWGDERATGAAETDFS